MDALTGLSDRATFDSDIAVETRQALQMSRPLALLFVDVDHFKQVNDNHGHQKGDDVLREVAGRLRRVADCKGKAYRYGGEEIVVVLPNHTRDEAIAVAERARRVTESEPAEGIRVTVSVGVGLFPDHAASSAELIKAADAAVYDAKNLGRNVVRVFGEPPPARPGPIEPERKVAEGSRLTERQRREMRSQHFRGHGIVCPDDGAILEVIERNEIGSPARGLIIICPMCGLNDEL